jgi:hypothetical protein
MSSRIVPSVLTSRLTVALPTCGPPMRKNTSGSAVGGDVPPVSRPPCRAPTPSSAGELTGPASKINPEISTPPTSATVIGTTPLRASSVAMPEPEHDRVAALYLDRAIDCVDAGREDEVLPARESVVDRLDAVGRLGDVELDRDRVAGGLPGAPARPR